MKLDEIVRRMMDGDYMFPFIGLTVE